MATRRTPKKKPAPSRGASRRPKANTKKKKAARKRPSRTLATRAARRGKKRGTPPLEPTPEQRLQVEVLVGLGLTYKEVAYVVVNPRTGKGISTRTLQAHFADELEQGQARVKANVVTSLVKKAISKSHPQAAACAMFIAKCRFGWRQEDKLVHEVEPGSTGVLVAPAAILPDDWIAQQQEKNAKKDPPKGKDD